MLITVSEKVSESETKGITDFIEHPSLINNKE